MNFIEFREKLIGQFKVLEDTGKLFRSKVAGKEVWETYLESFNKKDNPKFRDPNSSKHNGNLDKNFIRRYGNIVALDGDLNVISIFDIDLKEDSPYYNSAEKVSELLRSNNISQVFFETLEELKSLPYEQIKKNQEVYRLGIKENHKIYSSEEATKFGVVQAGKSYKFNHFYTDLNKKFVNTTGKSVESIMSVYKSSKDVFKRTMEEIPADTLQLVGDLIKQGSLLNGDTHLYKVEKIFKLKCGYDAISPELRDNWCWEASYGYELAKFKNELIGVLCTELAEGEELNKACQSWNKRVDPANYMKAVAPITKAQIERAEKFVSENGYEESFNRRFATIKDISVAEIAYVNSIGKKKSASLFDNVKASKSTKHKRSQFDNVEEVSVDKFMQDILPQCESVELFLENKFENNLVTITTANNKESKPIFKMGQ